MTSTLLAGLSLIDSTGLAILATTVTTLLLGIIANLWLRARYAALEKDLRGAGDPEERFPIPSSTTSSPTPPMRQPATRTSRR